MKSILNQIQTTVAIAALTSVATFTNLAQANAAAFNLSWTGNQGYSAQGKFSYDDAFSGNIITKDQLKSFDISFFNPQGVLLREFNYSFPNSSSSFNFNFDRSKKTVLQTGNFDRPNGFDLGSDFNTVLQGLFFYTFGDSSQGIPAGTIFLKDDNSPETSPAFCQSQPTNPSCRLDLGGSLTATLIPEPGTILGLFAMGFLGKRLKKSQHLSRQ
ncbi:PEP-CTERM sorting domain-containing protein [Nostoc sp. MS1]|uniref:PEP-CTERM sorting domain-containing protein n=1 Tax=Nostoc sp. MS1 TaxID=2764711 RepID=UPI001CC42B4F|nr:PEP-CTERM sorting domain-containing protein [Nostoc sp. MS1]BCL36422.1 hypothetical protein NSMS1_28690 [Nostoc sp. MS1]